MLTLLAVQGHFWGVVFYGVHFKHRYLYQYKAATHVYVPRHVACASAGFGKVLKKAIRQVRPVSKCEALGVCNKPGMPSSHSQVMFFLAAVEVFQLMRKVYTFRQDRWQRLEQLGTVFCYTSAAILVAYSRVYLGYHDIPQVLAGAAAGIFVAAMCFAVTAFAAKKFPSWQQSTVGRLLKLKDTWVIDDILLFEYINTLSNNSRKLQ